MTEGVSETREGGRRETSVGIGGWVRTGTVGVHTGSREDRVVKMGTVSRTRYTDTDKGGVRVVGFDSGW